MTDKVERIFLNVSRDPAFKRRFFKKLAETDNPFPWFKELQKRKYLEPNNNKAPELKTNSYTYPYWAALGYLENVAKHIEKDFNQGILHQLIQTINSIIDFRDEKTGQRVQNPYTDWMVIRTVFRLPVEHISEKYIQFIETALSSKFANHIPISSEIYESIIPRLIEAKNKVLLLKLIEIIIKPKDETDFFFQEKPLMEKYWLSEAINKYTEKIVNICGLEIAQVILKQIEAINARNKNHDFWVNTIEKSSQTDEDSYRDQIVYVLRTALEQAAPAKVEAITKDLIKSHQQILKRIGIYTINYHYKQLGHLLWSWKGNPLDEHGLTHEVYELFKTNYKFFSTEEFEKLIEWIEKIKPPEDNVSSDGEKNRVHEKRFWLTAVIESNKPKIKKLYEEYTQIDSTPIEHPGYLYWSSGAVIETVDDSKPLPKEVTNGSNNQIADYLRTLTPQDKEVFDGYGGPAGSFRKTVIENYQSLATDLSPFLNVPPQFQYGLLWGIYEITKKGEKLSWREILDFIFKLISKQSFLGEKGETNSYKNKIAYIVGDLILSHITNEEHTLDIKQLEKCEKILLLLGKNVKTEVSGNESDIINRVLNSALGVTYSAMIAYSYKYASLAKTNSDQKWPKEIRKYFDDHLLNNRTTEFNITLGKHLTTIAYLDKYWLSQNINKIFPQENSQQWIDGFSSYLFYTSNLSKPLYHLLRENNHYEYALKAKFPENSAAKLPQLICIAYLNDLESLDKNSLVAKLIQTENTEYLAETVRFIWRLRKKLNKDKIKKIKPLWKKIVDFLESEQKNRKYDYIRAELAWWLSLVDKIDKEILNLVMISLPHLKEQHLFSMPEYLLQHTTKTPEAVGEILYKLTTEKHFIWHKKEQIIEIVNKLYEFGQEEKANRICQLYLREGHDFLRETYEKYSKEQKLPFEKKDQSITKGLREAH
ncbi:MAG: hypothetical protein NWF04_10120 [Candidatus Bathyarchaeota archaeon]|nr:hypothetical protein [Candidatus Bathyarchaeota archaeon]